MTNPEAKRAFPTSVRVDFSASTHVSAVARVVEMRELEDGQVEVHIAIRISSGDAVPMRFTAAADAAKAFRVGGAAVLILAPGVEGNDG